MLLESKILTRVKNFDSSQKLNLIQVSSFLKFLYFGFLSSFLRFCVVASEASEYFGMGFRLNYSVVVVKKILWNNL